MAMRFSSSDSFGAGAMVARRPVEPVRKSSRAREQWAFSARRFAEGEQSAQPAISGAIGGPHEQVGGVGELKSRADDELEIGLFGGLVGADDAGQGVHVGDGDGAIAQLGRAIGQLIRMRMRREGRRSCW